MIKLNRIFPVIALFALHATVSAAADLTSIIPMLSTQEHSNWCWAAVTKSAAAYKGRSIRQCDAVDVAFGYSGVYSACVTVKDGDFYEDSPLNQGLSPTNIQKVLAFYGIGSHETGRALQQAEYQAQINANRPFIIAKLWGTPSNIQGGHALLAYGYNGAYIEYWDPWLLAEGGGQKSVLYTSLLSSPSENPPFFWGDSVTDVDRSSAGWGTWYIAEVTPYGTARLGGYVPYVPYLSVEVDSGTTTSYELNTRYSDPVQYGTQDEVITYLYLPATASNKIIHFRARGLGGGGIHYATTDQTFSFSPTARPVAGACGSSDSAPLTSPPTQNLCSAGAPSVVSGSGPWSWTCSGLNGGGNASCSTSSLRGACGSSYGAPLTSPPTQNLCSVGTPSAVSGSGPWSWTCYGLNGANQDCETRAVCGSADGQSFTSEPTSGLCAVGTPGPVYWNLQYFEHWSWGCKDSKGIDNVVCTAKNANPSLGLYFQGDGHGSVNLSDGTSFYLPPPHPAWGSLESLHFPVGTQLTVTASPKPGSYFQEWHPAGNGGSSWTGCTGMGACAVNLDSFNSYVSVYALFSLGGSTLTVAKSGTGAGTVKSTSPASPFLDCGPTCSYSYAPNTPVTLVATPDPGSIFAGWGGACSSVTGNTCTVNMSATQAVDAKFAPNILPILNLLLD